MLADCVSLPVSKNATATGKAWAKFTVNTSSVLPFTEENDLCIDLAGKWKKDVVGTNADAFKGTLANICFFF